MMPQIFTFTAGNPEARQHLVDSIENQIDEQKVAMARSVEPLDPGAGCTM